MFASAAISAATPHRRVHLIEQLLPVAELIVLGQILVRGRGESPFKAMFSAISRAPSRSPLPVFARARIAAVSGA